MTELRADAQRNLDRVLEAASDCFAEQGVDVSIDEIARRAGVGHGTVFRRFPSKDALLSAVVLRRVVELTAAAEAALGEPDAGAAGRLVRRAQRAGALRRDVGPRDVLELIPAANRHPDVILDGLRVR